VVAEAIHDGDSLTVKDGFREIKVVLCGLDAPGLEQALGTQSHESKKLVGQGKGGITLVAARISKRGGMIAETFNFSWQ
jgi:hypothetical protein